MMKYFILQLKRLLRILPALLVVCAFCIWGGHLILENAQRLSQENQQTAVIALVGTQDDLLLKNTVAIISSMDQLKNEVTLIDMEEMQAENALKNGQIAAYAVFPEAFLENALHGTILPVRFVSVSIDEGLVTMIRNELTDVVSQILFTSEYGAFALAEALREFGYAGSINADMNEISYAFATLLFSRENIYTVELFNTNQGRNMQTDLICGLCVAGLFLICVPFAPVLIREEPDLVRLLASRKFGAFKQIICEFCAFMLMVSFVAIIPGAIPLGFLPVMRFIPVIFVLCAISFLVYNFSNDVVGGGLLQLFLCLLLLFFGGCLYPVYFMPIPVQKLAGYLPTSLCQRYLVGVSSENNDAVYFWLLLLIGTICIFISAALRYIRLTGKKGGRR